MIGNVPQRHNEWVCDVIKRPLHNIKYIQNYLLDAIDYGR